MQYSDKYILILLKTWRVIIFWNRGNKENFINNENNILIKANLTNISLENFGYFWRLKLKRKKKKELFKITHKSYKVSKIENVVFYQSIGLSSSRQYILIFYFP